jgi:hypothetical protein
MAQPLTRQPVERVRDRAGDEGVADLAQARRPGIDVDELDVDLLRQVRHAHQVVIVEVRLLDGAVFDRDALVQRATNEPFPYSFSYPHLFISPTFQQPVSKHASYRLWQTGCFPQDDLACEQVARC